MKAPAIQFYVKDWKADTDGLSLMAKGAWIQILCTAHLADKRGVVTRPLEQWARIFGTDEQTAKRVLKELQTLESAHVTFCPPNVTVVSRRMQTERKAKEYSRLRKQKQRASPGGPKIVPPYTASAFASAYSVGLPGDLDFADFYPAWMEWEAHRWEIQKPNTARSRKLQLAFLVEQGNGNAIAVINQSIRNGWRGLFPLKDNNHGTSKARRGGSAPPIAAKGKYRAGERIDA